MSAPRQQGRDRGWCRYAGPLLLALGLLPGGGCLTPGKIETPDAPVAPRVTELPPSDGAKACLAVAATLEREGHEGFEELAIAEYEKARHLDPVVKVSRQLALLYDRVGKQKEALREYQTALEQSPRDADLLNNFGYFYYNWGKLSEAEEKLRAALEINPKHPRAWNNLGLVLGTQQRYQESLDAFQQVPLSEAEAHSNLAFVLSTQGKVAEAREQYQQALKLEPNLTRARLALDKLEHPGKAAAAPAPPTPVEAARKAAQERLQARTPGQGQAPVAQADGRSRSEQPPIVVEPRSLSRPEQHE
jgi:Tfp pilus assembly protein PilF